MRTKNSNTIQAAANPAVDTGIRSQDKRLRRRYLSKPGVNQRVDVANVQPRFSNIKRMLPLFDHLQRYLPGESPRGRFSALNLTYPRHLLRENDRSSGLAAGNRPLQTAAAGQLPTATRPTITAIGRQPGHLSAANSALGIDHSKHTEAPAKSGHDTMLSAQGNRLLARFDRTPSAHKSQYARLQRPSIIAAKFIPPHLSVLAGHAHAKVTQFTDGQHRAAETSTGEAGPASVIGSGVDKGAALAAQRRVSTASQKQADGEADGVARSLGASHQPSNVPRQTAWAKREDDNGINPKTSSGDEPQSKLQLASVAGKVLAPGSLDDVAVTPQTAHRRLQPQRQDPSKDSEAPSRVRPQSVSAKYPPTRLTLASTTDKSTVKRVVDDAGRAPAAARHHSRGQVQGARDGDEGEHGGIASGIASGADAAIELPPVSAHTGEASRPDSEPVDVSSGLTGQTVAARPRQKQSASVAEDKTGIFRSLPLVGPERFKSSTAEINRSQRLRRPQGSPTLLAQKLMSNSIRGAADNMIQQRHADDARLPVAAPGRAAQLKSKQTVDRQPPMDVSIANGKVPPGNPGPFGFDAAATGMVSPPGLAVVKSAPHGVAAKANEATGAAVSAPAPRLSRRNESHAVDRIPLTLARSPSVDQGPSMIRSNEPRDSANRASERSTGTRDDPEPDAAEAQELKTDELVERVVRKVLRSFSVERERRGWFPWN